jgi:hypothetical protein
MVVPLTRTGFSAVADGAFQMPMRPANAIAFSVFLDHGRRSYV